MVQVWLLISTCHQPQLLHPRMSSLEFDILSITWNPSLSWPHTRFFLTFQHKEQTSCKDRSARHMSDGWRLNWLHNEKSWEQQVIAKEATPWYCPHKTDYLYQKNVCNTWRPNLFIIVNCVFIAWNVLEKGIKIYLYEKIYFQHYKEK